MVRIRRCTSGLGRVDRVGVLALRVAVAVAAPDALVAAAAERPAAVLGGGAVAGQEHRADVGRHAGVVHDPVQLVHGVRAERVADLRPVERDTDHWQVAWLGAAAVHAPVVREVGQALKTGDGTPALRVERLGDLLGQFGARAHRASLVRAVRGDGESCFMK